MSWRRTINNPRVGGAVVAGAFVLAALVAVVYLLGGEPPPGGRPAVTKWYYFDTETKKLYAGEPNQLSPIDAPSGAGKGVQAYVYGCGSCADESSLFIAYLSTLSPEAKAAAQGGDDSAIPRGTMISSPEQLQWVAARSPAAGDIVRRKYTHQKQCPPDQPQRVCWPGIP